MQIILLDKIKNLGDFGDQIDVKSGYARNFLIPYGMAVLATKKNIEYFELRRVSIEHKLAEILSVAEDRAKRINTLGPVTIFSKSGKNGKLFGSVGIRHIINAITLAGIKISKNEIRLINGPIRTIGEHKVNLKLHSKVSVKLTINVVSE